MSAESGKLGYTLPCLPGPAIAKKYGPQVEAYGHACAEAARAPLLERIAKLERSVIECANTGVRMMDAADQEIARLRTDLAAKDGEVKKYRADAERWKFALRFLSIEDVGDEKTVFAVCVQSEDLENALALARCWSISEAPANIDDAINEAFDAAITARKGEGSEG